MDVTSPIVSSVELIELEFFKLSQLLLEDPRNPQLLVQKGILLAELDRLKEAFDVFDSLRQTYPDQPLPYVNLASVYARWGRLEEARQMLIKSDALLGNRFQTHISLASLNISLALEALVKARELKPDDVATLSKIRALEKNLKDTNSAIAGGLNPNVASSNTVSTSLQVERPARSRSAARAKSGQSAAKSASDRLRLETLDADLFSTKPEPVATANMVSSSTDVLKSDVVSVVNSWASSWIQRSQDSYLSYYSSNFEPAVGMQRSTWEQRKRFLISRAKFIRVDLKIVSVKFDGDIASVLVKQKYQSDRYTDNLLKELKLRLENGHWKIISEKPIV